MNITGLLEFGLERVRQSETIHFLSNPYPPLEWTDIYPTDKKFQAMQRVPKTKDVKIKEIVYKTEKIYGFLSGIQLKFTNGFKTPMFETQLAKDDNHEEFTVQINPKRDVRFVKVRYEEFSDRNTYIHGLSFLDKGYGIIVDLTFANYRSREAQE